MDDELGFDPYAGTYVDDDPYPFYEYGDEPFYEDEVGLPW